MKEKYFWIKHEDFILNLNGFLYLLILNIKKTSRKDKNEADTNVNI